MYSSNNNALKQLNHKEFTTSYDYVRQIGTAQFAVDYIFIMKVIPGISACSLLKP